MSILFRCPCGRSMVVESDRAGAVVTCPNCKRALKVPSGKDRGVELAPVPAAAKTRTSRRCQRCGKDVPVDSQMCPHCKTILVDASAAAPAAGPKLTAGAKAAAAELGAARAASPILYGGSRATWWSRLSTGGKAGVLIGSLVFVGLLAILMAFIGTSFLAGQLQEGRSRGKNALEQGKKLECQAKFKDAYDLYFLPAPLMNAMKESKDPRDQDLYNRLKARADGLQYLVPEANVRGSLLWKPKDQSDLDATLGQLAQAYPAYRQLALAVGDAGLAAAQFGETGTDRAAYEEKVGQLMETYLRLVGQTTMQQRSQMSFQQMLAGIEQVGLANKYWDSADRKQYLINSKGYFNALKELVSKPGYPDAIW